jgi:hypothetical protein
LILVQCLAQQIDYILALLHFVYLQIVQVIWVHPASDYFAVKKNVEKSGFKVEIVSGF